MWRHICVYLHIISADLGWRRLIICLGVIGVIAKSSVTHLALKGVVIFLGETKSDVYAVCPGSLGCRFGFDTFNVLIVLINENQVVKLPIRFNIRNGIIACVAVEDFINLGHFYTCQSMPPMLLNSIWHIRLFGTKVGIKKQSRPSAYKSQNII